MCFVVLRMNTVFGIFITSSLIGGNVIVVLQILKNPFYHQINTQILILPFLIVYIQIFVAFKNFLRRFIRFGVSGIQWFRWEGKREYWQYTCCRRAQCRSWSGSRWWWWSLRLIWCSCEKGESSGSAWFYRWIIGSLFQIKRSRRGQYGGVSLTRSLRCTLL